MTRQLTTATGIILRAAQRIDAVVAKRALELGITPRQIDIILMLADEPGLSQVEMMQRCMMDRSTLSSVIRLLARGGYVKSKRRKSDSRALDSFLTAKGEQIVADARRIRDGVDQAVDGAIKTAGSSTLSKLRNVIDALEQA